MKLLEFIFRGFWTFVGFALLMSIFFTGIGLIIQKIKEKKQ